MPAPSKINSELPEKLRLELERRIKDNGFGGYRGLSEWLKGKGYEISKSAVHTHGQNLQRTVERIRAATQQAEYVAELFPDDDGKLNDAMLRTYQAQVFEMLQTFEIDPATIDPIKLARVLKDLSQTSISQKKLMRDMRRDVEAEMSAKLDSAVERGKLKREAMIDAKREMGLPV